MAGFANRSNKYCTFVLYLFILINFIDVLDATSCNWLMDTKLIHVSKEAHKQAKAAAALAGESLSEFVTKLIIANSNPNKDNK